MILISTQPIETRVLLFLTQNPADFALDFRFRKHQICRVHRAFRTPDWIHLDNRSWVVGEEAILLTLSSLAFPQRLFDLEKKYHVEKSRISRILKWTKAFIYDQHRHRVQNFIGWHAMHTIRDSKAAFQTLKQNLSMNDPPTIPHRTRNVCVQIDGWIMRTTRPRGYHDNNGIYIDVQGVLYSGYKKIHNLAYLALIDAFGLMIEFSGPFIGKNPDL